LTAMMMKFDRRKLFVSMNEDPKVLVYLFLVSN